MNYVFTAWEFVGEPSDAKISSNIPVANVEDSLITDLKYEINSQLNEVFIRCFTI